MKHLVVAVGDHQVVIAVTYRVRSTNMRNNLVCDFYVWKLTVKNEGYVSKSA